MGDKLDNNEEKGAKKSEVQEGEDIRLLRLASKEESVSVYLREDGTFYYTVGRNKHKYAGVPSINLNKGGTLLYTYHPSKAVFTGASSGNVAMGGVHYTKAYMAEKFSASDKGSIEVSCKECSFTIDKIQVYDFVYERFNKEDLVKRTIYCYDTSKKELSKSTAKLAMQQGDFYKTMTTLSIAKDYERLPMQKCKEIAEFINRVFTKQFPLSDAEKYKRAIKFEEENNPGSMKLAIDILKELGDYKDSEERIKKLKYERALSLEEEKNSRHLKEALDYFRELEDYKDSSERIQGLEERYNKRLKEENEQLEIRKETFVKQRQEKVNKSAKRRWNIFLSVISLVLCVKVFGPTIMEIYQSNKDYNNAMELFEEGKFRDASQIFELLANYRNSEEMEIESKYQEALLQMKKGSYLNAANDFNEIDSYKDSKEKMKECLDLWMEEILSIIETGEIYSDTSILDEGERLIKGMENNTELLNKFQGIEAMNLKNHL